MNIDLDAIARYSFSQANEVHNTFVYQGFRF
ncbi:hypothetical protein Anacy_3981 [Anabaena cylindrica PCC 7122]|uniref:Uncharacterized protein n=1 Tax=Anabaena cylindrica (strain ATCC 27899 / PCC 7122) TaxID=272123 RepID=K9ZLD8_ANACC|nr:hypothetical protein Anacy_3981 [Anabaena cylindrica PCC 7122]BAY03610.1 hypothetical protein NIES19_28640 [Anabaena cylindrica PCC 7122]